MSDEIRDMLLQAMAALDGELARTGADDPMQWRMRRAYLDSVLATADEPRTRKNVFVSYSTNNGKFFREVKQNLAGAGLEVLTGFDVVPDATKVLDTVLSRLTRSSIYVGILTPDTYLESSDQHRVAAPGVWIMVELGMALALRKPFVLMIHKHIHRDFWRKVASEQQHLMFADRDYKEAAKGVVAKVLALRENLGQ
jgi:hypothetical protein